MFMGQLALGALAGSGQPDGVSQPTSANSSRAAGAAPCKAVRMAASAPGATAPATTDPATVAPTWTACLGLPKRGLACGCDAGTLVLMDVGLPAQAVHALGLPYRTPFTDQYMVALHPAPPA